MSTVGTPDLDENREIINDLEEAIAKLEEVLNAEENPSEEVLNVKRKLEKVLEEAKDETRKIDQGRLNEALQEGKDVFSKLKDLDNDIQKRAHQLEVELSVLKAVHGDVENAAELDLEEIKELE